MAGRVPKKYDLRLILKVCKEVHEHGHYFHKKQGMGALTSWLDFE